MTVIKNKKSNTYEVRTYYKDWTGVRKQKTKRGFKRKCDAQEWERAFKLKENLSLDMYFEDFVDLYLNDIKSRIKYNTWLTKKHIVEKKILPYFSKKKLQEIKPSDIRQWQNTMMNYRNKQGEGYSQVYLKTIHNQLSAILNHAVNFYDLKSNAARKAGSMGKERTKEMLFWTKEEYMKFIEAVADKPISFYAFEILYWCGVRMGELLALTPEDFDFQACTIRINKSYQRLEGKDIITDPKTVKSNRIITMPEFLSEELESYIGMLYGLNENDRIFQISKSYLHHEMDRGVKLSGVKRIRIHDLRHPYVKHTTKIFSLRLMDFQAQAYPDARRKTRGACQLLRVGQSRSPVRPLCNRKRFSCLPPQSKMSWILYAISMRLSGYTSTRSISSSASSVVSVSASKIALDASMRLSCRACSSCFCFACANTAA